MAQTSAMQGITREIRQARRLRLQRDAERKVETELLVKEAQDLLRGFADTRRKEGAASRTDLKQGQSGRSAGVKKIVRGFRSARQIGTGKAREESARNTAVRKGAVDQLCSGAHRQLQDFSQNRAGTAEKLQQTLAESTRGRRAAVAGIRAEAKALLSRFHNSRETNAHNLKKNLAQARSERSSKLDEMRGKIAANRSKIAADLKDAAIEWRQSACQKKNARKNTATLSRVEVPPPDPASEAAKNDAEHLEAKFMDMVVASPGGATLSEVAKELDVLPVVLARTASRLLEKGLVRKENKLYTASQTQE